MTILLRPAAARGMACEPGLRLRAAFCHAGAHDPGWLGFGALRVLNHLELDPGATLPPARRANMEILSLVLSGRYRASSQAGDSGILETGQVLWLGAGSGVDLLESNPDPTQTLRLLQLWVQPERSNRRPRLAWIDEDCTPAIGELRVLAAARQPPLAWDSPLRVERLRLAPGATCRLSAPAAWVELLAGEIELDGQRLRAGDGAGLRSAGIELRGGAAGADLLRIVLPL